MRITVSQLRKIIKEEAAKVLLEYEQAIERRGNKLYLVDDDGNEDFFGNVDEYPDYEHLRDGEAEPYQIGTGSRDPYSHLGRSRSYGSRYRW